VTLVNTIAERLSDQIDRRGFLGRIAMWGAALVTAPSMFILTPTTAYAAICGCHGQSCNCSAKCCGAYTEFCCTIYGENACPPGGIIGGWWRVDGSSFCGGSARYYMDCHRPCGGCSCGSSGICSGSCNGTACGCANHNCSNRKAGCVHFRYGNCNNQVSCIGPIICRVVTCTVPWQIDAGCSTAVRVDNGTRYHDAPCLHNGVDPNGFVSEVSTVPGSISIKGWVLDLDSSDPQWVHTYIDGIYAGATQASISRRDVQAVYGTATDILGFEDTFAVEPGAHRVCVHAINVGAGNNRLLSCTNVNVPYMNPVGAVGTIEAAGSGVRVRGWAFDPSDKNSSVTIQVSRGSDVVATFPADQPRNDVRDYFRLPDNRYGFDEVVPAGSGTSTYCVRALDIGDDGSTVQLGCQTLVLDRDPIARLGPVTASNGEVQVRGWAVDPDSPDPVGIHVYADSTFIGGGRADAFRPDVGDALGVSDYHGFDLQLPLPGGTDTIRVFAINIGPGRNTLVGRVNI
jgi:hypothetical protein